MKIISIFLPLDISPECEELGLDKYNHGEMSYDYEGPEDETIQEILISKLCSAAISNDVKKIDEIIKFGVDPYLGDVDGRTVLHVASSNGSLQTVKYLVEKYKVDVNVTDNWGSTPLRNAQLFNRIHIIEYLISNNKY